MKIAVIADTHMPQRASRLPAMLERGLADVDLIVHAGDWTSPDVVGMLERYAPVEGVCGNNDGLELEKRFGRRKILTAGGCRIGLIHGHGSYKPAERTALDAFRGDRVDVIVFGHSHIPLEKVEGDRILFNPGSPTDKRRQPLYSYGVLEIADGGIKVRHIFYTDKSPEGTKGEATT